MPIKPDLMRFYPGGSIRSPEWLAIRRKILKRARYRCERCQAPDGLSMFIFEPDSVDDRTLDLWGRRHAPERVRFMRIVLAIAHLNHNPSDNRAANLKALCQRCHLEHDRKHHARSRRARLVVRELL